MRGFILIAIVLTGCGPLGLMTDTAPTVAVEQQEAPNEIIVKFRQTMTVNLVRSFHARYGAKHVQSLNEIGYHLFRLDPGINPEKTMEAMRNDPRVLEVEFNYTVTLPPQPEPQASPVAALGRS